MLSAGFAKAESIAELGILAVIICRSKDLVAIKVGHLLRTSLATMFWMMKLALQSCQAQCENNLLESGVHLSPFR